MLAWKDVYATIGKIFTLTQETQKKKSGGRHLPGRRFSVSALM
jgi:hypothetical protein